MEKEINGVKVKITKRSRVCTHTYHAPFLVTSYAANILIIYESMG